MMGVAVEMEPREMRVAYAEALVRLAEENPDIVILEADLMKASATGIFQKRFPDRAFNVGVAEANEFIASLDARESSGGGLPGSYLPESTPSASGDQTICPIPLASQSGITAGSIVRHSRSFSGSSLGK